MHRKGLIAAAAAAVVLGACAGGTQSLSPVPSHQIVKAPDPSRHHTKRSHATANVVQDPGFESDGFTYWTQCGTVNAAMSTSSHTGTYAVRLGTTAKPEINGDAAVCQAVTVPASGQLSFWIKSATDDTAQYAWQEA
ncbi:MAG: hypothetical protein JO199_11970, partial [Candidatus Eremiobacteraeota bacterium]|nr:hypothetical protein [Candidatus Eremiobacteraeota bacterium]